MSDGGSPLFCDITPQGLRLRIRLTPSGRRDGIDGVMEDADGQRMLKASVTTVPEGGKANQALIKMLAKEWKVAKSAITVVQGQTSRNKVLMISGEAAAMHNIIAAWAQDKGLA
ncbi:DUF167 family protein [Magnetovibrio sp.]|uniref:DUF167 domain-containing protein n=1 Tax=Magnetovibrio sp. TaxID=2024836 RepID=UPI002F91FF22